MTHRKYLSIIAVADALAWVAFITVIFKFNPEESTSVSLAFFYSSIFIALSCTFTLIGYYFRLWLYKNEIFYAHINISLRQGIILSLVAVGCLVLLMLRVLSWWSGGLLILASILLEFYFSSLHAF